MGSQFEWHITEEEEARHAPQPEKKKPRRPIRPFWGVLLTAAIALVLIGRQFINKTLDDSTAALITAAQDVLDLQHEAYLAGDGELFFSVYVNDDSWKMAQLLPSNQAKARAGLQVTTAEESEERVWATVNWEEDNETWQSVAFFLKQDSQLLSTIAFNETYWGDVTRQRQSWGGLILHEVDAEFGEPIAAFVDEWVAELCADDCVRSQMPFTLFVRQDFRETAVADELYIPSPRLVALDENNQPGPQFWQMLRQKVEAHLTPATLRFGIPPAPQLPIIEYDKAAAAFMALHPQITIELVQLESERPDLATMLALDLDGAAVIPTAAMLATGQVHDLTDYKNTDIGFNAVDFYEQIWPSAFWQDRMWFVPQMAEMRLLFYDRNAYTDANQPEPSLRWTWAEMEQDIKNVVQPSSDSSISWGYLDREMDTLYSYAYNWHNDCTERATVRCDHTLEPEAVVAALAWYRDLVTLPTGIQDLTGLSEADRETVFLSSQSARRHALIWVEQPIQYEYHVLLAPIGVVPFPGSDRFDGITPLQVQGGMVLQQSERPLDTWQWLTFLSYQPIAQFKRVIPARPSMAAEINYWSKLPLPLGNALRTAFPFARPISIEEQSYFTWEQVTAVISGEQTPEEVVQSKPNLVWFTRE
jgi:ABC-type glycerol-3-phosphate transport system substrate-binding protein